MTRSHVLVVGGTGMLQGVSLYLASQGNIVSVIARDSLRLNHLTEAARTSDGYINPIQVDYKDRTIFRAKLEQAVKTFGPMTTAVCWIHRNAPEAPYLVAESIDKGQMACRYFDILGSAAAGLPDRVSQRKARFQHFKYLIYRKVTLGIAIENGISRWLSDYEISRGVVNAIESDEDCYVVGDIHP